MDLINREVTEPMAKANRENSRKSTGPRTEQGKLNSRPNAFRHGIYARELCPWAEELDEDEAEYRRFCRRYREAFQVRDEVEGLLVQDMANTRWRLEKRLLRAESGCLAWQRQKFENEHRRKRASEGMDMRAVCEQMVVQPCGYSALSESEAKYELILVMLRAVRVEVEQEGYTEMGAQCLQTVYGQQPGVTKKAFLLEHRALKLDPSFPEAVQKYARQRFLSNLQAEVENFRTLRDCLREERGPLFEMERDAQLMLPEKAAKIVAAEENRLRNYIQQVFKQFIAWRQRPAEEKPIPPPNGSIPPGARPDGPVPPACLDGLSGASGEMGQPIAGSPPPTDQGEGSAPEPAGGSSPQASQPSSSATAKLPPCRAVDPLSAGRCEDSRADGSPDWPQAAQQKAAALQPQSKAGCARKCPNSRLRRAVPSCALRKRRIKAWHAMPSCAGGRRTNRARKTPSRCRSSRRGNRVRQALPLQPQRVGRRKATKYATGRARAPGVMK